MLGNQHDDTLSTMRTLAVLLGGEGDIDGAITLRWEMLQSLEAVHGATHEKTRNAASELAGKLQKAGKKKEARTVAEKYAVKKKIIKTEEHTAEEGGGAATSGGDA